MISKNIDRTIAVGGKRLDYKAIVYKVVDFLDQTIDCFPQYLINSNFSGKNEKDYNQMLATYFNNCAVDFLGVDTFRFSFIKDTSIESSNYNPDIGVMLGNKMSSTTNSFFHIECKRLPARDKKAEREYVQGKLGGIQRFKEGNHGKGLDYSAMIGYVQSEPIEVWYERVNSWIDELIAFPNNLLWTIGDKLSFKQFVGAGCQKFESSHQRQNHNVPIILYHYWISIN
jgi:hypothetical protein